MRRKTLAISFAVLVAGGGMFLLLRPVGPQPTIEAPALSQALALPPVDQPANESTARQSSSAMARIYETHEKVINYTVAVPVHETRTKEVTYTVMNRVTESRVAEVPYTVIRTITEEHPMGKSAEGESSGGDDRIVKTVKQVPESRFRSVSYTVTKMVPEQRTKTVTYKTCRMVTETRQKTVQYTVCRTVPAEAMRSELEQEQQNTIDPNGSNRCLN